MKKIFVLLIALLLIPVMVKAEVKEENLNDVILAEGITISDINYVESDEQITIYLFRGQGCHNCTNFVNYLNSLLPEYGKYFKLKAYEVWNNADNGELMDKVSAYFNDGADGIPYIIIGEKAYIGFNEEASDAEFKNLIVEEFNKENRFDVMDHLGEQKSDGSEVVVIAGVVVLIIIGFVILARKSNEPNSETRKKNLEE